MSTVAITPERIRTIASQSGFCRLYLADGNVVRSLLINGRQQMMQEVGEINDDLRLREFCRRESIDIVDDRTPYIPGWVDDPWIWYGA